MEYLSTSKGSARNHTSTQLLYEMYAVFTKESTEDLNSQSATLGGQKLLGGFLFSL